MHFVLRIVVIVQICIYQCYSEWIKITQNESDVRLQTEAKEIDFSAPSPVWIEYQKERFSGTNISQRLVISGESHLKTSAEIIVPAQIDNSKVTHNKILRTKMEISLNDSASGAPKATPESFEEPQHHKSTGNSTFHGDLKFPSFMGFVKLLTSLQKSLLTSTTFGIMDKIKVLKSIRNRLMLNIEDRFGSMFPKSRQKRGLTDESSFQFPSEAALMSISFLTFSVFLIKLVLQVIHIIKSKHYSYSGMAMNNMNTMTMAKSGLNARKFGESQEDLETLRKVSAAIKINPFTIK